MEIVEFEKCDFSKISISTICLGSFDGFHLGHQHLISTAVINSSGNTAIVLFSNHPTCFVGNRVNEIMSLEQKIRFANKLRLDYAIIIKTDRAFYSLSSIDFINNYLKRINSSKVVVGEDFRFGLKGEGTPELLKNYFKVATVPLLTIDNIKVSSTEIRHLLAEGDIKKANKLLGYNYEITSIVVEGLHNGTKIDFPTANIKLDNLLLPNGVYAGICYVGGIPHKAMINIGVHPTIEVLKKPIIEIHLLDFNQNIYGKTVYLEFIDKIRDEKKFADIDELKEQLINDKSYINNLINY